MGFFLCIEICTRDLKEKNLEFLCFFGYSSIVKHQHYIVKSLQQFNKHMFTICSVGEICNTILVS